MRADQWPDSHCLLCHALWRALTSSGYLHLECIHRFGTSSHSHYLPSEEFRVPPECDGGNFSQPVPKPKDWLPSKIFLVLSIWLLRHLLWLWIKINDLGCWTGSIPSEIVAGLMRMSSTQTYLLKQPLHFSWISDARRWSTEQILPMHADYWCSPTRFTINHNLSAHASPMQIVENWGVCYSYYSYWALYSVKP